MRLELTLEAPSCVIDVRLENPGPDRSFVLVLAETRGALLQRVRLAGGARIYFAPRKAGTYLMFLSNPGRESVTLYLRARSLERGVVVHKPAGRSKVRAGPGRATRRGSRRRRRPADGAVDEGPDQGR